MRNKFLIPEIILSISAITLFIFQAKFDASKMNNIFIPKTLKTTFSSDIQIQPDQSLTAVSSIADVSGLFYLPRAADETTMQTNNNPPVNDVPTSYDTAAWIKPLGTIRDAKSVERIYMKDTRTNTILKFRTDKIEENDICLLETDAFRYLIKINNQIYQIPMEK